MQSKAEKAWEFMANREILGDWPCGCKPFPEKCVCKKGCKCEQQVALCEHMATKEAIDEYWPHEKSEAFLNRMAEFYLLIDPENYADMPIGPPSPVKTHENHIRAMSKRVSMGYAPINKNDRYYDLKDRAAEVVETLRNGGIKYTGKVIVEGE